MMAYMVKLPKRRCIKLKKKVNRSLVRLVAMHARNTVGDGSPVKSIACELIMTTEFET